MLRGFNLIKQLEESKAVIGLNMLALWDGRGSLEPWVAPLSAALEDGAVSPVVHAAVPFAEAPQAHRILAARENVGWCREAAAGASLRNCHLLAAHRVRLAAPSHAGSSVDPGDQEMIGCHRH
jgi:hypothetical protein